jgi:hypothetical protein
MPRPQPGPMREPRYQPPNNRAYYPRQPISEAPRARRMPDGSSNSPLVIRPRASAPTVRRGKFGVSAGTSTSRGGYVPTGAEGSRRPVFTPLTSTSYRQRVFALKSYRSGYSVPIYSAPAYWNTYAWDPFFSGFGFYGDPFDFAFLEGSGCFGFDSFGFAPFGSWNFDPYDAEFAYPPLFSPFFGPGFFCGGLYSPAFVGSFGLYQPACAFCGPGLFDPYAFGWNDSFLDAFTLTSQFPTADTNTVSSGSFSGAVTGTPTGLIAATPSESSISPGSSPGVLSAPPLNDAAFSTSQPTEGKTLTLVFANGSKVKATRYWLGGDGELHYVTASGGQEAVPVGQFDMSATMKANHEDGVQLIAPPSPQADSAPGPQ